MTSLPTWFPLLTNFADAGLDSKLKQLEKEPMFFVNLLEIVISHQVDPNIKLVAMIHFKNTLEKYWRKTSEHPLSAQEKQFLRERLVMMIGISNKQLATQHALALAKVARLDYPLEWPNLFLNVTQRSRVYSATFSNESLHSLMVLYQIIKTLASKTLASSRKAFKQVAPELLQCAKSEFILFSTALHQNNNDIVTNSLRILCKIFEKLVIYGFDTFSYECILFYQMIMDLFQFTTTQSSASQGLLKLRIAKINNALIQQKYHDLVELPQFPLLFNLYIQLLTSKDSKLVIKVLVFLKNFISKPCDRQKELLTTEFIDQFFRHLVLDLLKLTPEDLEMWQNDPEQFVSEEESDYYEFNVRSCAEKLVIDLMSKNREQLQTVLVELNEKSVDLLEKEAVWNAFGLCAHDLYDFFDFDHFFEAQLATVSGQVLLRRLCLVASQWIGVKVTNRARVYEFLLQLSSSDSLVLKLTVLYTLYCCLDDWEFNPIQFEPFLKQFIGQVVQMIPLVQTELKLKAINCLSIIVERCSDLDIQPLLLEMASLIPELWSMGDEHLFLSSILVLLTKISAASKDQKQLTSLIYPILSKSLNHSDPSHVYLYEDALDLWLFFVEKADFCQELLDLFRYSIELMQFGTENLKKILVITEIYLISAPLQILSRYSMDLLKQISVLLENVTIEASQCIMQCLDVLLVKSAEANCLQNVFAVAVESGLVAGLIRNIFNPNEMAFVVASYQSFFTRLATLDYKLFLEIPQHQEIMTSFTLNFEKSSSAKEKRLVAYALALLLDFTASLEPVLVILSSILYDDFENAFEYASEYDFSSLKKLEFQRNDLVNSPLLKQTIKKLWFEARDRKEMQLEKVDKQVLDSFLSSL